MDKRFTQIIENLKGGALAKLKSPSARSTNCKLRWGSARATSNRVGIPMSNTPQGVALVFLAPQMLVNTLAGVS